MHVVSTDDPTVLSADELRAKALDVSERLFEDYGEPIEGALDGILLALVYVGDCIRGAGVP